MSSFEAQVLAILGVGAVIGAIAGAIWWFSKEQRVKRALRALRKTPVAQVRGEGLVKLTGTVHLLDELKAPLSGRPCAYFDVLVEERVSTGKSSRWRTVIREIDERDFLLDDGTGRARVEMVAVEAAVTKDGHWSSGTLNDASPALEAFLARHGQRSEGWVFNRALRYREGVLEAGEIVAVVGWAELEHDPEPTAAGSGYRDAARRPVVRANGELSVRVSDDPSTFD